MASPNPLSPPRLQPLLALAAALRRLGTRRPRKRLAASPAAPTLTPPLFVEPRPVSEALTAFADSLGDDHDGLAYWLRLQAARAKRDERQLDDIVHDARADLAAVQDMDEAPGSAWVDELRRVAIAAANGVRRGGDHELA